MPDAKRRSEMKIVPYLSIPIAAGLGLALVIGCTDAFSTAPEAADIAEVAGADAPDAAFTKKRKDTKRPPRKRRGTRVVIDNNLPDGACPPTFQRVSVREHDADRNGDDYICVKLLPPKRKGPPRKKAPKK